MAKNAWLAAPIAVVVLHRLAWGGGATSATATLGVFAVATFAALFAVGLILRRLGVTSRALGIVLAGLFWLSAPTAIRPDWVGPTMVEPAALAVGPATTHRDLIVIMIDDHPTSQALLVDHGYDNAEFQDDLLERGFRVMPEPWSNSSHPSLAIASALAGRYPGTPATERDRRRIAAMLEGDSPVADVLRDNGYATTHLGSPSALSIWLGIPDRGATLDEVAEAVETATGNDTPDFVFAHVADCDLETATAGALDNVVTRAMCNNRLVIEALDHLDAATGGDVPSDPVVVIAGTRGSNIDADLGDNPAAWPRSAVVRGLGVFSAVRLAPGCQPPPDDATVAVLVHHGLACALGVPPNPPPEQAVVIKGDVVEPDGILDVNLAVLRSSLAGQTFRKSQ